MEQDIISISWKHLPWKKFQRKSFRLQCKIYEAKCSGSSKSVKRLQKLLIKSKSVYYLAVKKVTDYYSRKGLFLSSEMKLNLSNEIYAIIIGRKYFSFDSYAKNDIVSIENLKYGVVNSILKFLIEPFFLHFFYRYRKPKSLDSQFFLLKELTSLFLSKFKENFVRFVRSGSVLPAPLRPYNSFFPFWVEFFSLHNNLLVLFWKWQNFKNPCRRLRSLRNNKLFYDFT